MVRVRCSYCLTPYVMGTATTMMQSQRWPTVFLHAKCSIELSQVWYRQGLEYANPILSELVGKPNVKTP